MSKSAKAISVTSLVKGWAHKLASLALLMEVEGYDVDISGSWLKFSHKGSSHQGNVYVGCSHYRVETASRVTLNRVEFRVPPTDSADRIWDMINLNS